MKILVIVTTVMLCAWIIVITVGCGEYRSNIGEYKKTPPFCLTKECRDKYRNVGGL